MGERSESPARWGRTCPDTDSLMIHRAQRTPKADPDVASQGRFRIPLAVGAAIASAETGGRKSPRYGPDCANRRESVTAAVSLIVIVHDRDGPGVAMELDLAAGDAYDVDREGFIGFGNGVAVDRERHELARLSGAEFHLFWYSV